MRHETGLNGMSLAASRIREGVWEAVLTGAIADPGLEVLHLDRALPGFTATPRPDGSFALRLPIPAELLCDGVQTFLVRQAGTAETLAHFTIVTGVAMEDDLRAEIDLLRAELDMLKRAFRQHCLRTEG